MSFYIYIDIDTVIERRKGRLHKCRVPVTSSFSSSIIITYGTQQHHRPPPIEIVKKYFYIFNIFIAKIDDVKIN